MEATQIYLKELENKNVTQAQILALIIKARNNGDENAREEVLKNYLLHVVKIAREYMNMGIPLGDLISEGNIGLIKAFEKYDVENGATFGSYSKFWIRQSIIRNCMHKRRIVRLPENISELIRTDRWKGSSDYKEFSMDVPSEDGSSYHDKFASDDISAIFQKEETLLIKNKVKNLLSCLDTREAQIVKDFFGIDIEAPLELNEIALKFSLTTTRISQIVRNSLNAVRDNQQNSSFRPAITVLSASYGSEETSIDITEYVIDMVANNKNIKSCNKIAGDPCRGTAKFLFVQYEQDGKILTKKTSEGSYVKF